VADDSSSDGRVRTQLEQGDTAKRLRDLRMDGLSRRPDPRIPGKHALNPPIATVFGAGVAGLTAAHELMERGFLVQVIEEAEDPYCPGRPRVGGMAANQPARVRANIEDLHRDLIAIALTPPKDDETEQDRNMRRVAAWLLRVFAFNRSRWIKTEQPYRINGCIFSSLGQQDGREFEASLKSDLMAARARYKERWLWDLAVRGVKLGILKPRTEGVDPLSDAHAVITDLLPASGVDIANTILGYRTKLAPAVDQLPLEEHLKAFEEVVTSALEREFLCFRLVPYAREGFEDAPAKARDLYDEWAEAFAADPILSCCCVSKKQGVGKTVPREHDGVPVAVEWGTAPPEFPHVAWLQLEVIEQRLPGEHGYRFFPSFYRHLDDTMGRIPLYLNGEPTGRSVRDNLRPTLQQGVGLSKADREELVAMRDNTRRKQLEKDDPKQEDTRYPEFDDPLAPDCRASVGGSVVELTRQRPRSFEAFRDCADRFVKRLGGSGRDAVLLLSKLARYLTSSPERRRGKYEQMSWSDFLGIREVPSENEFSPAMQFHIRSAAQALLAFSAGQADARTYGNVAVQMFLDEMRDGTRVDRTLNGPTSDTWLEPWREHLERQGVRFFHGRLNGLIVQDSGGSLEVVPDLLVSDRNRMSSQAAELLTHELPEPALQPDFYVLALNIERSRELVENLVQKSPEAREALRARAPDFADLLAFWDTVEGTGARRVMTGIQYFFDAKTAIGRGHLYFPFSPWGLSSITQSEFWSARGGFAEGYFGLLSVDVCTTGAHDQQGTFLGTLRPTAGADLDDRSLETAWGTLQQIQSRLLPAERMSAPRCFHIDDNVFRADEPLFLASVVGLDETRPGRPGECVGKKEIKYRLNFDRWALCGTFMSTHTRMTTMESANESARHAVAAILRKLQTEDQRPDLNLQYRSHDYQLENLANKTYNWASILRAYEPPETWNMEDDEVDDLDLFRRVDRRLVDLGLPHFMDIISFDKKLKHALDAIDIYGEEKPLSQLFGGAVAGLDSLLTKELGQGYYGIEQARWREAQRLQGTGVFGDMTPLNERWKEFLDVFANLIRPANTRADGADLFRLV